MGFYEEMDKIGHKAYNQGKEDMKREILEILKKNNVRIPDTNIRPVFNNDGSWYFGKINIFEEIEKL